MQVSGLQPIYGIILAGGQARRMGGGDKGLRPLGTRPILGHVIDRLKPQVAGLWLNANGDLSRFATFGLPVMADTITGQPGPLAGILAGLEALAAQDPAARWLVTVPGDCPFLPADLVAHLAAAVSGSVAAVAARYEGRLQPVIGLWSVDLRADLRQAITLDGLRRVEDWLQRCDGLAVDFPRQAIDPFFNVNNPDDLARAATMLSA